MKTKFLKKVTVIGYCLLAIGMTSCNDWLDVLPNNEQVTDNYWKSKEDVEAVISSGYYYLRQSVPTLLKWGELRGGAIYTMEYEGSRLQDFNMTANSKLCDWSDIYKVIGLANSVILYAPTVKDNTYDSGKRNSHLAEAYFLRDYCYLLLVKNYKEVPLVLQAYVNDAADFDIAKSKEEVIIAQIKEDIKAILATGAAKSFYEEEWQTKGRVTKWALYALMADACLWSEDYDQCIEYCDYLLKPAANEVFHPAFLQNTSDWYTMFEPGNSNESIFELNNDYSKYQESNKFAGLFNPASVSPDLRPTPYAVEMMKNETQELIDNGMVEGGRLGRMLLATYVPDNGSVSGWLTSSKYLIWKYYGLNDVQDIAGGARPHQDANFIIYRMAEIMLMKAQALTMKGESSWKEAVALVNTIRHRAGLPNFNDIDTNAADTDLQVSQLDEYTILEEILDQKEMEFMAEGKRWYDVLWLGRISNNKYKSQFIAKVLQGNNSTNPQWILSVLQDQNAWYMPIPQADIEHNKLLEQNPYYGTTK